MVFPFSSAAWTTPMPAPWAYWISQVTGGLMNGLGLQGTSLRISLFSNLLSVLLMYVLAAQPQLRLYGAIIAMAAAQVMTLCLSLRALHRAIS